jgi:hypothetical protein
MIEETQPQLAGADGPKSMNPSTIDVAGLDNGLVRLTAEQLDSRIECRLLRPGSAGWDDAVLIWNGMVAKVPALVLRPRSAVDVAAAVGLARDHRLSLSVKGGGHNMAGTSIADRGLTLDMSRMRDVTVDPDARLAQVGSGCLLQDVDRATQAHGLATPLGSFSSEVGVAGLTLGGGLGYLTRRFGWTADNLEEVEIVTADGQIRTASRDENADLHWALRGGGGNFGVVTRFTFRLHEVGPTVSGGLIVWSADRVDDVLATYRDLTEPASRKLTAALTVRLRPRSSRRSGTAGRSSGYSCATAARTPRPTSPRCAPSAIRSPTSSPRSPTPISSRCSTAWSPRGGTTTGRPNTSPGCRMSSSRRSAKVP